MQLIKYSLINLVVMLALDAVWLKLVAGSFYAKQLEPIARLNADGSWNVRMVEAVLVYVVMAVALEIFVFRNSGIQGLKNYLLMGAFLGFSTYAVFDLTNRAILDHYPWGMVLVDVFWGTLLFSLTSYFNFVLRKQLNIF